MKIPNIQHYDFSWRVQELAKDFHLEDVWEFPTLANPAKNHSLYLFRCEAFDPVLRKLQEQGFVGILFKVREWLGLLFGWDASPNTGPIPGCRETSLKERLSEQDRQSHREDLEVHSKTKDFTPFQTVYVFENEVLQELSNRTVHALLHLAWIPKKQSQYTVQLAVYVKPRGWLGAMYMRLIIPFRYLFVYPAFMKLVQAEWQQYLRQT